MELGFSNVPCLNDHKAYSCSIRLTTFLTGSDPMCMQLNFRGGIYQHDNARTHTTNPTTNVIRINNVNVLDNHFRPGTDREYLGGDHNTPVCTPTTTEQRLTVMSGSYPILRQEWINIPENKIANVICSMRHICVACIQATRDM